jgi:hypothetical protein
VAALPSLAEGEGHDDVFVDLVVGVDFDGDGDVAWTLDHEDCARRRRSPLMSTSPSRSRSTSTTKTRSTNERTRASFLTLPRKGEGDRP